ncbi:MAG: hypothetical protein KIH02_08060 [Parabacteroides sp.]|nr:hypothetical protein [Parabacteroides sp.]
MEDNKIINECNEFLQKSNNRYSDEMNKAVNNLRRYSGKFWDDEYTRTYRKGKNRLALSLNNWNVIVNAIASPISSSPYHIELSNKNANEGLQERIDLVEHENDNKSAVVDAFRKAVLTGYGFIVISTEADRNGDVKIVLESVKHINSVALDPAVNTVDGSDAEEGAIVNYISTRKARRLYGEDVIPFDFPNTQPLVNLNGLSQWTVPADSVAIVSYYVKNEDGTVNFYKICGNKVVQNVVLPISIIPIIRFAGNEIYSNDSINYSGIIDQTLALELGANIAYSTLIERCGRSVKPNVMAHVDAIDGLEKNLAALNDDDSMAYLWKGEHQPVILTESFQTGDLQATISTCRMLMEDVTGIPLTGISNTQPEKTATEILRQQMSKESNTANYYNNAYVACYTLGRIITQMLSNGEYIDFHLENGPAVITRQLKARQELTALATLTPDNMKPLIAKYFADTLQDDVGDELSKNIVANLPQDIKFFSDKDDVDPEAIHELNQMRAMMDQMMADLEQTKAENAQLAQQLKNAETNLLENEAARKLDMYKFQVSEANKMQVEAAKLELQGVKLQNEAEDNMAKNDINQQKVNIEEGKATIEALKAYEESEDKLNEAIAEMQQPQVIMENPNEIYR